MRAMLIIGSSAIIGVVSLAFAAWSGGNQTFDPHRRIGDSWTVRYTAKTVSFRAGPPQPETLANHTYRYEVIADEVEHGRNVTRIRVDRVGPHTLQPRWLMTFDRDEIVLLRVEELVKEIALGAKSNPSIKDAWMPYFGEFSRSFIHDFPRIPATAFDETRTITTPGRGSPFTQSTVFGQGQVTANLFRIDPHDSVEHRTTIVWKAGAKWWSSAVTTLGGEVQISAVLETTAKPDSRETSEKTHPSE